MRKFVAALIVFVILSFIMTLPLGLHLSTALENDGDLPGGIWFLGWTATNLWSSPSRIFENPTFFPHPTSNPHGYHTYVLALLYVPFYFITRNYVAAWNLLYILTYAANGFCMYLFVLYLTRNRLAGTLSGIIFAFCPFRFGLYGLTAFHSTYWIPLAFLFLLIFFDRETVNKERTLVPLALAFLFFLLQCLTDFVLGLYFSLPFFAFLFYLLFARRRVLRRGAWCAVALAVASLAFLLIVFALLVRPAGGRSGVQSLSRDLDEIQELSAEVQSYLAVSASNILYGRISRPFFTHSMAINFPGCLAYLLAICSIVRIRRSGRRIVLRFRGHRVCAFPCLTLAFSRERYALFFLLIFMAAFLFSLGPHIHLLGKSLCPGPYIFVYRLFPLIRPVRALGWLSVVAVFAVSVLAGIGAAAVLRRASRRGTARAYLLAICLILVLLVEYVTYPPTTEGVPYVHVPAELPAVYRWLMQQPDNGAIIELPMPWEPDELQFGSFGLDSMYLYWSLFHRRRLVNGYTSLWPAEYKIIVDQMKLFPSRETIDILNLLGVRYVVFHSDKGPRQPWQEDLMKRHPEARYDPKKTVRRMGGFRDKLALRGKFGFDYVYELAGREGAPREEPGSRPGPLDRSGWSVSASHNAGDAPRTIDGIPETAWSSKCSQRAGITFQVDLGEEYEISGITLEPSRVSETPKNFRLEASVDGTEWIELDYGEPYLDLIGRLLESPDETAFRLTFPPTRGRHLRFTLTRFDNLSPWSIVELNVFAESPAANL